MTDTTPSKLTDVTDPDRLREHGALPDGFPAVLKDDYDATVVTADCYPISGRETTIVALDVAVLFDETDAMRAFVQDATAACEAAMRSAPSSWSISSDHSANLDVENVHMFANEIGRVVQTRPDVTFTFTGPTVTTATETGTAPPLTAPFVEFAYQLRNIVETGGLTSATGSATTDAGTGAYSFATADDDENENERDSTPGDHMTDEDDDSVVVHGVPACPACEHHDAVQLSDETWVCQQHGCHTAYDFDMDALEYTDDQ